MMSRLLKALPFGLAVGAAGLVLSFLQPAHDLEEDLGLGLLFKLRGMRSAPADALIVSIDKESSERLNVPENPDKWPRSLHARLTERLAGQGAKVIVFDVHFLEPRAEQDDRAFAAAVRKAGNVVIADALSAREIPVSGSAAAATAEHAIVRVVRPFAPFAQAAAATAPFVLPRIPFKVNQYWTFQSSAGDAPTFPVVAFQLFTIELYRDLRRLLEKFAPEGASRLPADLQAAVAERNVRRAIRDIRALFESDSSLAPRILAELELSGGGETGKAGLLKSLVKVYGGADRRYLNYYGPPRTVKTIPYYRAIDPADIEPGADFRGKAVFVGLSERLLAERKDSFYTVFSQANGLFIGGVEIAATAFLNMLEDRAVVPIPSRLYFAVLLVWGIAAGTICRLSSMAVGAVAVVAGSGLYLFAAAGQFATHGLWYPIAIPLFVQAPLGFFGAVLWNYIETNKERQHIRKALAYYVPDEVVDQLAKNIVDMKSGGQTVFGACLFADIAGYTTLSERLSPQQLRDVMHRYFEAAFEPVKRHGGLVVNLKGDSFLAIWKAVKEDPGLRRRACLAALDVAEAVRRFNASLADLDLPTRVGVHSGQIFLGNIGAGDHYEYGPTGDTVNTASRMDGLNKYLGTEVLASQEIVDGLDGLFTRELGKFRLKGKAQPIVVHELLGLAEQASEKERRRRETFAGALRAFRDRSWENARMKFHQSMEMAKPAGPERFYLELCDRFEKSPPEEPWDGVVVLEEK
ncbi:MAG TPA: adenylate/guanylate cyclase domain-containing protein [candidate division Zixibacteria bacterium]|nr:adenylate/guanylate cyclase domain-containing protein [candidate division Zixibacteria bacterium]